MVQELACTLHGPESLDLVRVRSFLLEHSRNEAMPTLEAIQGHFTDIKEHNEATLARLKWFMHAEIPLEAGDITPTPRPHSPPEVVNTKLKYCTDSDLLKAKMSIITENAIEWMNKENWDEPRHSAWELLKEEYLPRLYKAGEDGTIGTLGQTTAGYLSVMQQFIQGLDGVFFDNKLAPYCEFRFGEGLGAGVEADTELIEDTVVRISVQLSEVKNIKHLTDILLHELCHALQLLLGCDSAVHYSPKCVAEEVFIGPIEHPVCFLDLSLHVENLATTLFGQPADLGRKEAILQFGRDVRNRLPTHRQALHDIVTMRWWATLGGTRSSTRIDSRVRPVSGDEDLAKAKAPI
ncbi:hypothetical protein TI39_contig482g00005 [Zymoseptoria brevis]|uniref:Uncharacterized protein n=1 Tax=Zymoseptoria brevis TaxID=1047168 RepID=A0A0F4GMW9_9PEZI|nr:hypothetical protein TI39_contig482g00005 [Zymoseptoria brevis]